MIANCCEYKDLLVNIDAAVSFIKIMLLTFFVCAIVSASVGADFSDESLVFRKCCPNKKSLVIVAEIEGSGESYKCLDRESVEKNYNISVSPLIVGDSALVEYGLPEKCDEPRMVQLTKPELEVPLRASNDQCYDKLVLKVINGTSEPNIPKIVALTCINKTEVVRKTKIDHFRKCCPKGQSYDTEYHLCRSVNVENNEEWLLRQLEVSTSRIYEVENGLNCKLDEYSVELREELFSLTANGSSLSAIKKDGARGSMLPPGEWCMDREFASPGLVARVCTRDCASYGAYCMRKCCPVGQHYRKLRCGHPKSKCVPSNEVLFNISVYLEPLTAKYGTGLDDTMGIQTHLKCPDGMVLLNRNPPKEQEHEHRHELTREGFLDSPMSLGNDYCLETFDGSHCAGGSIDIAAVICFINSPITKDFRVSFVLNTISFVCLALTLVVYCSLPELRNLHGKTLICHVITMLLAFICLARVQYDTVRDKRVCTLLGYGIYFGFVAAFAWLNVMCLDIWWTFGSVQTVQPLYKAGEERRRFLWYSLYAWSVSLLLTVTMYLLDKYPVAKFLDSDIGNNMCWFGSIQNSVSDWPHYIFFVIPMGLVSCTNFVLWVLTARHCARVKSEVHRLQAGSVGDRVKRRFKVDRAKYVLTGKLWVVMGAGWVSELLSTLVTEPKWLWSIIDLVNELQGVFIFLILVFKPKVYYLIRKRLGLDKPDPQKGTSSSARTFSTFLSRTVSTDERTRNRTPLANNVKQS